uniref:Reverse transcriptase domain-containing protein n=1 Tax=Tanacetum cinerariifolium TaxID=118510 RepID=A0A6L2P6C0_TANCI|nr:reverse transcriptase domain-containing protein [Tanacetum cinerariifolium]
MVAFLSKSDASAGFDQIVDFLNAQVILYALIVNPTIYVSCIKQFWATASIKKANDVVKLRSLIDGKRVVVSEDVIRQDLHLDDADGVECLPTEGIFTELARMGYEKPPPKLTFYKAFFSAQWKFLIHTLVQCVSAKRTAWNEFSCSMASAVICLATVDDLSSHNNQYTSPTLTQKVFANMRRIGKGFFKVETPLFATMLVQPQPPAAEEEDEEEEVPNASTPPSPMSAPSPHPQASIPTPPQAQPAPPSSPPQEQQTDTSEFSINLLNTLMETCATLSQKVTQLEQDKIAQALEIFKLKKRVKKLEKKRRSKSSGLKRLRKVGAELQGRKDDDNVATKDASAAEPTVFDDEEVTMTMAQTLIKMKAEKARLLDEQMAKRLHDENMVGYKMEHFRGMIYDKVRTIFEREYNKVQTLFKPDKDVEEPQKKRVAEETLLQESFKKLKAVKVSVIEFKVEALQVKYPLIDWEIHSEGSRSYWKIIRVDGITEAYQSFEDMLKGFDREDLDALFSDEDFHEGQQTKEQKFGYILQVIKKLELKKLNGLLGFEVGMSASFKDNKRAYYDEFHQIRDMYPRGMTYEKVRPIFKREYNKVQTLFKPDKDEEPTKKRLAEETLLQESFKKLKAVGVSEKNYPLSNRVMTLMLSAKLQVEKDSEMARDLVMKIFMEANKPKSRISVSLIVSLDLSKLAIILNRLKKIHSKGLTNSIHSFVDMMGKFLSKYFPPSMVTKLRNEITKFEQKPHESLFEAWECYKLSIDRCPNHNMLLFMQIDTFYNGFTLSHRDTINAAAGGTFMQKTPEECYELIENMTAHHNHWDTSAIRDETSRNIFSTSTTESPEVVKRVPEVTKDTVQLSIKNIQPPVAQTQIPIDEPVVALKPKPTIPYASRANTQKLCEKDNNLALKYVEIFMNLHIKLSFADALLHMPKFSLMFKSLFNSKEKLFDLATTLVNENCSAVILKKLPEKLGDPGKTGRALIDVYSEELTLCVVDEAITFKASQTLKYSYNDVKSINRIDVIDLACEEYVQEVLGFFDNSKSGNPTPISDTIIALSSPSITLFDGYDFILEEIKACLTSKSIPPGIDDTDFDLEGDIRLLEELLNNDPSSSPLPPKELNVEEIKTVKSSIDEPLELELKELPSHLEYAFLEGTDKLRELLNNDPSSSPLPPKELNVEKIKTVKSSIDEPLELELKELPSHLEYAFLEGTDKLRVIISKELKDEEKSTLLRHVPKVHDGHLLRYDQENDGGAKNLAADHLSRLENPHQDELEKKEITETFPLETLERTISENHASWSDKLDDALWAFCTTFKTPIGYTPYKLVYRKACHLPIELEHKAYWALKHCNFDLKTAGDHRKVQVNELNELQDQDYENSLIYKEKIKKIHDSKIKDRFFKVGDRVLLFNSRFKIFSGKLKTRWTGPFTVAHVFPSETMELSQADVPNFKVNDPLDLQSFACLYLGIRYPRSY